MSFPRQGAGPSALVHRYHRLQAGSRDCLRLACEPELRESVVFRVAGVQGSSPSWLLVQEHMDSTGAGHTEFCSL